MTFLDPLAIWERAMANVGNLLRIKYGLRDNPTPEQARRWAEQTRRNIQLGLAREDAGDSAAKLLFSDYRTHIYAGEADTIEMLLREIENQ